MEIADPFHVKEADELLVSFLLPIHKAAIDFIGGGPDLAEYQLSPNALLERSRRRWAEGQAFLEGLLPKDLHNDVAKGRRLHELFLSCPEILTDGLSRPDLSSLVAAIRSSAVACWDVYRWSEPMLGDRYTATSGEPPVVQLRWKRECNELRLPWLSTILGWIEKDLRERCSGDNEARRLLEVRADDDEATRKIDADKIARDVLGYLDVLRRPNTAGMKYEDALAKLAILAVPGICVTDVREMLQPAGLEMHQWVNLVQEVADGCGSKQTLLDAYQPRESQEPWAFFSPPPPNEQPAQRRWRLLRASATVERQQN